MKKKEELVRKVTRVGKRSLSIVIPSEIVQELGLRERQKLSFKIDRNRIIISDFKS
jgi:antitoxin component of MazEF toxin-antitoxin module